MKKQITHEYITDVRFPHTIAELALAQAGLRLSDMLDTKTFYQTRALWFLTLYLAALAILRVPEPFLIAGASFMLFANFGYKFGCLGAHPNMWKTNKYLKLSIDRISTAGAAGHLLVYYGERITESTASLNKIKTFYFLGLGCGIISGIIIIIMKAVPIYLK